MGSGRRLFAVLAAFLMLSAPTWANSRELVVAETHPPGYPTVLALEHMGKTLERLSQGKLRIKVVPARLMGEETETLEKVRDGTLDMTRVNMAPLNALVPETVVPSLPFVFRSGRHLRKVFDGVIGAEISNAFLPQRMVVLAYYDSGTRSFYSRGHPIHTPGDMRGMRVRVPQSPVFEAMAEALGAVPVPLPYGQIAAGLKTGVVEGAENNWPSFQDARHYEVAPYYSQTEHVMVPDVLVMSRHVWDGLSAREQSQIRQAAQESAHYMQRLWQERESSARKAMAAWGVTVTEVDKPAFARAMTPVYDRFAASPAQKALLRRIQAAK